MNYLVVVCNHFGYATIGLEGTRCSILVTMTALSDLLQKHKGDRSVREIGRACAQYGVGESTIIPYFSGKHGANPPEEVLHALSKAVPLDIRLLREAAGVPRGEDDPYTPPAEANRMSFRQRRALDELIRSFTAQPQIPVSDPHRLVIVYLKGPDAGRLRVVNRHQFETELPNEPLYDILFAAGPEMDDEAALAAGEAVLRLRQSRRSPKGDRAIVETESLSVDETKVRTPRTALRLGAARAAEELKVEDGDERRKKA